MRWFLARRVRAESVARTLSVSVFILAALLASGPCRARMTSSDGPQTVVDVVAKVIPTVVSISTHRIAAPSGDDRGKSASFSRINAASGSGFIVDPEGYIATNRHVVDDAYEIIVTFSDGRTAEARLLFKSTAVDLAFLKVDLDKPLPAAKLAANQNLRVGERVLAIGNPLGLGMSVSAGIVSAIDRNIKESPYDAFIQTDAAINHGSSGGPLVNSDGEVVGINTALFTSVDNGGSQGLGFAIPGRDVTFLIDEPKRYKSIRVGWLGLNTQKLTRDMAEALQFPGVFGAIVATVVPGSPASKAGIYPGDIVQSFDDEPIVDTTTLSRATALSLGKHVVLRLWRDGLSFTLPLTIEEADEPHGSLLVQMPVKAPRFASAIDLGLALTPMNDEPRPHSAPTAGGTGLRVADVAGGSAAQEAGIRNGDIIVSAQMVPIATLDGFEALMKDQAQKGRRSIVVLVQAAGGERWVALPLRL